VTPSTPQTVPSIGTPGPESGAAMAGSGLARMRQEYDSGLELADLAPDWPSQFERWFAEAVAAEMPEPNAMIFATADPLGRPSARTVLLKDYDQRGFTLFTNYGSRKGAEALANPYASLVFPWFALGRQVVVCGTVSPVDRAETEDYFRLRPREAQLGAWASPQSTVIASWDVLDEARIEAAQRWPEPAPIPAPPHWGGLRVAPETVEFWQGRAGRLHDRMRFRRTAEGWIVERLAP
jgi:pyridoxamine 5'-phosphate oxidase